MHVYCFMNALGDELAVSLGGIVISTDHSLCVLSRVLESILTNNFRPVVGNISLIIFVSRSISNFLTAAFRKLEKKETKKPFLTLHFEANR